MTNYVMAKSEPGVPALERCVDFLPPRRLAAALALSVVGCTTPPSPTPPTLPDLVAERSPGVVRIEVPGGYGSGFVVDRSGLVVTGYHVVAGSAPIEVAFIEANRVPVTRVVAWDELHDLAIIQMAQPAPVSVPLGDSQSVRAGESVFTISSPFGTLDHTVTDGLISSVRGIDELQLFQISAPISTGSSGGPLFNARGEVIGVTTLIVSGGQNVNFAVPVAYLKNLLSQRTDGVLPEFFAAQTAEEEDNPTVTTVQTAQISLPPTLLEACAPASQGVLRTALRDSIRIAEPLCAREEFDACIRIYHGASLGVWAETGLEDCANLRGFLRTASERGDTLAPAQGAALLRETFAAIEAVLLPAEQVDDPPITPTAPEPDAAARG